MKNIVINSYIIDAYADAYAKIEFLQKEQRWSDEDANLLKTLISNNNPIISGAFDCFNVTKDNSDIAETLGLIIKMGESVYHAIN